jgi:hypothetical protein
MISGLLSPNIKNSPPALPLRFSANPTDDLKKKQDNQPLDKPSPKYQKSSWLKKLTFYTLGIGTVLSGIGVSRDWASSQKTSQAAPVQLVMTLDDPNLSQSEGQVYFEYRSEDNRIFLYFFEYTANLQATKFSVQELEKATYQIEQTYSTQQLEEMKRENTYQKNLFHTALEQRLKAKFAPMIDTSAQQVISDQLNLTKDLLNKEDLQTVRQTFSKTDQATLFSIFNGEGGAELQEIQIKRLGLSKYFGPGSSGGITLWDSKNFK